MNETQRYTVRANRGRPRIWLEGRRLTAAGFTPGRRYAQVYNTNTMTLTLAAGTAGDRKVSGKGDKPIIDLSGTGCGLFETGDAVLVTYRPGVILIAREVAP